MIEVRPLSPSDGEGAAHIFAMYFGDKFKRLTDLEPDALTSLVREQFFDNYDESYERCFIAKINENIVGAIFLEWNHGSKENVSKKGRSKRYGLMNTIRFNAAMRAMDVRETEGNCYLAKLAVSDEHRGKGIAGMLLDHAEEFAKEGGFKNMTLYVSVDNPVAARIYRERGFIDRKIVKSLREKILIGVPGWIYMTKVIEE